MIQSFNFKDNILIDASIVNCILKCVWPHISLDNSIKVDSRPVQYVLIKQKIAPMSSIYVNSPRQWRDKIV